MSWREPGANYSFAAFPSAGQRCSPGAASTKGSFKHLVLDPKLLLVSMVNPFVLCLEALLLVRFRWADICDNLLEGGCSNDLSPWTWNSSQGLFYSLPGQGEGGETWKESTWLDF